MKSLQSIRVLYLVSALYDGILGLAFIVAAPTVFAWTGVPVPNDWGYLHFAAALLLVFTWMFVNIARDPVANRNLVQYCVLLKVAYVCAAAWHWANGGIPDVWKVFAVADIVFAGLFVWSLGPIDAARKQAT